ARSRRVCVCVCVQTRLAPNRVGVFWGPYDPRNIAERCPGDQTNNRAELIAILRVLETTPPSQRPLMIKTDSRYSMDCLQKYISGWMKNGWRTSEGKPVKNAPIIRYIHSHLEARKHHGQKVKLVYVQGHSGDPGNDGADRQANMGARKPPEPEREWAILEAELLADLDEELVPPGQLESVLLDVQNRHLENSMESPAKKLKASIEPHLSSKETVPAPVTLAFTLYSRFDPMYAG
ncbi:ribonuclease H-like domain-containing protein, partial [Roridomyces roridus]